MAQVSVRMDDSVKQKAEAIFSELGLNMSSAINIFLKQVIRRGGLPFEMTIEASHTAGRQSSLDSLLSFAAQNRRIESGYVFDRETSHDR
ncbi:MAG: type II toxin-antitoxin system RelB/DinJ family antitoxin [Firmicutes bacterium]|nr:type II toxin-antitoxin system RelB/DinJ family antitoxin [Bacillota bacterium]